MDRKSALVEPSRDLTGKNVCLYSAIFAEGKVQPVSAGNSKIQASNSNEAPQTKYQTLPITDRCGHWYLKFIWYLVLETWYLIPGIRTFVFANKQKKGVCYALQESRSPESMIAHFLRDEQS
ncbi:MAG TPA: hypothetical protein PLV30_01170 [Candidatus Marinimicrobia bacterium]|nr:hypothetical protein [Candidatus Neomarinimicrobiota bacterium]HQH54969.1 hypothetical protein [Candidatus Neomarinimicrobiota bacterium]HQK10617.1 hypothetical protein [Candidatus Neomarinimicrobiota bacterium]